MAARNALIFLAIVAVFGLSKADFEPYEATSRYNVLPWSFKLDKLFAFAVDPLKPEHKPTNTLTYTGYPQWPFLGGPGYLVAIKFADSPIGAYSELFYIPGLYKPSCSFKPYFSVQRIWVDSLFSRHAGRSIWGIPKEIATFDWQDSPSSSESQWTFLSVYDGASGNKIISANMTDFQLPLGLEMDLPEWFTNMLPSNIRTVVQWPIDDSAHTYLGSKEAFAATNISRYTSVKTGSEMTPILTELSFVGENVRASMLSKTQVNGTLLTGHMSAKKAVKLFPFAVHLDKGSKASLSAPKYISTCQPSSSRHGFDASILLGTLGVNVKLTHPNDTNVQKTKLKMRNLGLNPDL